MTALEDFLSSTAYFSGLSAADMESITGYFSSRTAGRGEIILFEAEPVEPLYFVVSGAVKVFKTSPEGKEQILEIIRPGDSFNDVPVFEGGHNLASAEALGPVALYGIKKQNMELICRQHPLVARDMLRVLSTKIARLVALVEDLSFKNVTGRIAKILLEHVADGRGATQRLTQQEMAAIAGTAREMVGRSLKTLEEDKAIRLEKHRIVIVDKELLREIAGVLN